MLIFIKLNNQKIINIMLNINIYYENSFIVYKDIIINKSWIKINIKKQHYLIIKILSKNFFSKLIIIYL